MAAHANSSNQQLLVLVVVMTILSPSSSQQQVTHPNTHCHVETCGNVSIPFPFGTSIDCALDSSFLIDCNNTRSNSSSSSSSTIPPHTPFLPQTNITLLNISLLHGELRIQLPVGSVCFYPNSTIKNKHKKKFNLTHFSYSSSRNRLTGVGCNTIGLFQALGDDPKENGKLYTTGCVSLCSNLSDTIDGSPCTGNGCCQISLPPQLQFSRATYGSGSFINIGFNVSNFSTCSYGFLAEEGTYKFSRTHISTDKLKDQEYPVVLDWSVGNQNCTEAQKNSSYACKARYSECVDSEKRLGYLCNCSNGYRGNPYLPHGCQDINECDEKSNNCYNGAKCENFAGGYRCTCRKGYEGDGRKDGTGCRHKSNKETFLLIALVASIIVIALLVASFCVYLQLKKRKQIKLKEKWFQQNGGLLLQQKLTGHKGSTEVAKVFTEEELKNATANFDKSRVLGQGDQGTVYKGILQDNRTVAIKKSKINDPTQIEQFINEVIVLSQINHRNVVKLLGCCLETEVPLLVYEFIPNGTISQHLHDDYSSSLELTWETRLRIAVETAEALAYLHSATSPSIIHRDVKTTNILLDHNMTAKVSDFGASRIVPLDQTQLTTLVQGTRGYLDPEYFSTGHLTDKSDVYSFGVVLAELLTMRKAVSFVLPESDRNLAGFFVSSMKDGHLLDIVDKNIIHEAKVEKIEKFASVAGQCLRLNRDERPSMKKVAKELEVLRVVEENPRRKKEKSLNSSSSLSSSILNLENSTTGSGIGSGCDSINHISISLGGGR